VAILAALSAALLFVRGVIVGAATLLGLGFGLSGFAGGVERVLLVDLVTELLTPLGLVPLVFVFVVWRMDVVRVLSTDAGRVRLAFRPVLEGVRVTAGGLGRTDCIVRSLSSKYARTDSQLEGGGSVLHDSQRSASVGPRSDCRHFNACNGDRLSS
jgi:hypothetical protein